MLFVSASTYVITFAQAMVLKESYSGQSVDEIQYNVHSMTCANFSQVRDLHVIPHRDVVSREQGER